MLTSDELNERVIALEASLSNLDLGTEEAARIAIQVAKLRRLADIVRSDERGECLFHEDTQFLFAFVGELANEAATLQEEVLRLQSVIWLLTTVQSVGLGNNYN